jgi:hypothetical protein
VGSGAFYAPTASGTAAFSKSPLPGKDLEAAWFIRAAFHNSIPTLFLFPVRAAYDIISPE